MFGYWSNPHSCQKVNKLNLWCYIMWIMNTIINGNMHLTLFKSWSCWRNGVGWSPSRPLAQLAIILNRWICWPLLPKSLVFGSFSITLFLYCWISCEWLEAYLFERFGWIRIGVERKWLVFSYGAWYISLYPSTKCDKVLCGKVLSQAAIILRVRYPDLVVWFNYSVHT